MTLPTASHCRSLSVIAAEIRRDWTDMSPHAKPYVRMMATLTNISDTYGAEDGETAVLYFLSNARTWTGPTARRVKNELRGMAAEHARKTRTTR